MTRRPPGGLPDVELADLDVVRVVLPLRLRTADGRVLSLFSIASHLTTAADATLEDLTIESFHPADEATARALAVSKSPDKTD